MIICDVHSKIVCTALKHAGFSAENASNIKKTELTTRICMNKYIKLKTGLFFLKQFKSKRQKLNLGTNWRFPQNNGPEHTAYSVK